MIKAFDAIHISLFALTTIFVVGSVVAFVNGFIDELSWSVGAGFGIFSTLFQIVNFKARGAMK